ncbi:hypothetical protein LMG8520_2340 [Lactococcus lactis subsp. lactis]|uniref:Uncharacterized protein n=2 Tax=Lactococcus lactis TaxID=1358 RepID=A0A2A5SA92_LACLH|nr:hypothetical protein [Lactococcus lactis]KAA8701440.1 hypothetical protein F4V48_08810 [Lactococcus lactis subsp. hordniae]KSU05889.1 hypothetical protein LMG8520_2340 [Lactococcus lactis subsp. lactis]MCT3135761.1 hypothetical protein [Lactococcus lactis]PCS10384.1 hypothetical protein RU90_GL001305 [Lactococcus lactis subsp. hordniae]
MTETKKERIHREAPDNLIGNFDTSETLTVTMPIKEFDKLEKLALSAHTDKLSVERLQEHLLPYKKEMVQKIIDEKMQLVTADEFVKLHKESLTAIRENDKLQEQLKTAKKALTEEIESIEKYLDKHGMSSYGSNTRQAYLEGLKKALAAIGGGEDE